MHIAFVPARCGSKSIRWKNIKLFCGKPLIYWCLHALSKTPLVDEIYVATDCQKISSVVESFSLPKTYIYHRLPQNATDTSSTEDVILEFLKTKTLSNNDIFILAQATSPFIQSQDIEKALSLFYREKADSLLSCVRWKRFFWDKNGKPLNYNYNNRPRRQDFDGVFLENGAFYISKVGNILQTKNRLSGKIVIYEMPAFSWIELDEEDDWEIAEFLMKKHILNKKTEKNFAF